MTIASMTYSATSSITVRQSSTAISSAKLELDELNLDDSTDALSPSRPIGVPSKRFRSVDSSSGRPSDSKQRVFEFYLNKRQVVLQPGHNRIILSGKVCMLFCKSH